jgi:hypothetical protein
VGTATLGLSKPSEARQLPVANLLAYPESIGSWNPVPQPIRSASWSAGRPPPALTTLAT